jgi:hypothetical protein
LVAGQEEEEAQKNFKKKSEKKSNPHPSRFDPHPSTNPVFAVRPSKRSEFPKESGKVEFLASEVSGPEILYDLHLYLAFELFLCACCVAS